MCEKFIISQKNSVYNLQPHKTRTVLKANHTIKNITESKGQRKLF